MKRFVMFVIAGFVAMCVQGQTILRNEVLKSTDLGNQKLMVTLVNGDTIYSVSVKTGKRVEPYVTAVLGNGRQARHFLTFLLYLELKGKDLVRLENPSDNYVKKNSLGGFLLYESTQTFGGQLRKPNIKGFLEVIEEYEKKE